MRNLSLRNPTHWARITAIVVIASVGLALAHLGWRISGLGDESLRPVEAALSRGPSTNQGALGSIIELAPFGRAPDEADLPETLLPLVLKGVVYSPEPSKSFALISTGGAPAQTWGVGQAPIEGAVIEAIEVERIVLGVDGRREALPFPSMSASGSAPAASATSTPSSPPASLQPDTGEAAVAAEQPIQRPADGSQAASSSRPGSATRSVVQSPASGPGALLSAAGLSATTDGLRVGPDPSARLKRAGLLPGDLIRSLNGRPVADIASERQMIERAILAGSARVEVERDGTTLTLTLPLR